MRVGRNSRAGAARSIPAEIPLTVPHVRQHYPSLSSRSHRFNLQSLPLVPKTVFRHLGPHELPRNALSISNSAQLGFVGLQTIR